MADEHYRTLGVPKQATEQEIKKAFRRIARECHPDVAGHDDAKGERFKEAKVAYEVLVDPVKRARYDRRGEGRRGGSFFDAFYRATGERGTAGGAQHARTAGRTRNKGSVGGNDLDLEDLFQDFGMGGGGPGRPHVGSGPHRARRASPEPGDDVHVEVEVPVKVARSGGSVTAVYYRMQRADSWRPGSPDAGVVRVQDIADVRVIPGTTDGEVLRERGKGDAGVHGGPFGDLVVTVRVGGERARRASAGPSKGPGAVPEAGDCVTLDVSIAEALLGGRVELHTPQGRVKLAVPPCTSSGTVLRLRGKGAATPDGKPADLCVAVRIVVPRQLDEASKDLIEQFARLNPESPRG